MFTYKTLPTIVIAEDYFCTNFMFISTYSNVELWSRKFWANSSFIEPNIKHRV